MFDFRKTLVDKAEKCLHIFVQARIDNLNIDDSWKNNLPSFVDANYKNYPANYQFLKDYFRQNAPSTLQIDLLDITALKPLLEYYNELKPVIDFGESRINSKVKRRLDDLGDLRNSLKHYNEVVPTSFKDAFIIDQLECCSIIIRFCSFAIRENISIVEYKHIINEVLKVQEQIYTDNFFINDYQYTELGDIDFSDLLLNAESGNIDAQLLLGKLYWEGNRVKQDYGKAFLWFYKAAIKSNPKAEYHVSKCYNNPWCVDPDIDKSKEWLMKSANHGYGIAQYEYALSLFFENDKNDTKVVELLNSAINQNVPSSFHLLSLCYALGRGVKKDTNKAYQLKAKAASLGCVQACLELAKLATKDNNNQEALKWYRIADENGSVEAQNAIKKYMNKGKF